MPKKIAVENEEIENEAPSAGKLVAAAEFEIMRGYQSVSYKEGDEFPVPEGWTRDAAFEEFRKINLKSQPNTIAFQVPLPILDEKGKVKYMDARRVVLPLKEV
jgi:hypothetical protein